MKQYTIGLTQIEQWPISLVINGWGKVTRCEPLSVPYIEIEQINRRVYLVVLDRDNPETSEQKYSIVTSLYM